MLRAILLRGGEHGLIDPVAGSDLSADELWRQLESRLRPFVGRRVREADVDDVVQEVFVRLLRGLPALRDEERFGPWVYQVARSAIVDHLRSAARLPRAVAEVEEVADGTPALDPERLEPEDDVRQQMARTAALFVSMLPSPYREALTLTELEGLTQREAAARLGISLSGMKSRVQRGRRRLRGALEDCCHIALDSRQGVIGWERRPDGKLPDGCCS